MRTVPSSLGRLAEIFLSALKKGLRDMSIFTQASTEFKVIYHLRNLTGVIQWLSSPSMAFRMENKKPTEAVAEKFHPNDNGGGPGDLLMEPIATAGS